MNNNKNNEKSRETRRWARPRDFIILGSLTIIALALLLIPNWLNPADSIQVFIYHDGEVIDQFIMEEGVARILSYEENPAVEIQQWPDQSIAFIRSDCPDQVCIHAGRLRVAGQFAACLPNGFVIVLEGAVDAEGVDTLA
ncbi:MAG: NusG domain II-containing protein [Saccharofermentanales bacterium]|jgi:hypothetical protein|nr:NusG domain II-containing protein [Eubacteriales bacterium]MDD3610811.1 NusG domain II-containing protein [Eubacteriales bacterium]